MAAIFFNRSSLSHCWQIKKQFRVRLKCALTLQYFLKYERNPVLGLWCHIILHTIGSLVGHMCHTIIQWMLGRAACEIPEISLFGYLAVSWKESFCAQRGGILSGMRQKHARSCQVLFWTLWSHNHASLIFSPLIMQCDQDKNNLHGLLQMIARSCLSWFRGLQCFFHWEQHIWSLPTREIYCYILVRSRFTT